MAGQVQVEPERELPPQPMEVEEVELAPPPDEPSWTRRGPRASSAPETTPGKTSKLEPRDVYMAAFVNVEAPDFTLSELGRNVQDPKAAPVAPRLDLSGLSLAPAGSDMGQTKPVEHVIVPDISHLKLA
jgi:hypothetical protein